MTRANPTDNLPSCITVIDLQVNGSLGIDFSQPGLSFDDVVKVTRFQQSQGTTHFLPTIITCDTDVLVANAGVISSVMDKADIGSAIMGIHLEGPFLSPRASGAHPPQHLKAPDLKLFDAVWKSAQGRIALLTLAPELPGALELIREAVKRGVVVSLGHTAADTGDLEAAARAGASSVTHLGNGRPSDPGLRSRLLEWQLASSLTAMFIPDGFHLDDGTVRNLMERKGFSNSFPVSDCAPLLGMPDGVYTAFGGLRVEVAGERISAVSTGRPAGAGITMRQALGGLERALGRSLTDDEFSAMAFGNALKLLAKPLARLQRDPLKNVSLRSTSPNSIGPE